MLASARSAVRGSGPEAQLTARAPGGRLRLMTILLRDDHPLARFDEAARRRHGVALLAGVDEVGRGPLAGPVVAAAVILPAGCVIPGADDSKKLSPETRERLYTVIRAEALAYAVALVKPVVIDRMNILEASRLAMRRALARLAPSPAVVFVDGWELPQFHRVPGLAEAVQEAFPRADGQSQSVACASILAKVTRDRLMVRLHRRYPQYDFAGNKGYPTPAHLKALEMHGPCAIHRRSFSPVAQLRLAL